MRALLRPTLCLLTLLSILTGVAYPLLVTGAAQAAFPRQARGSLIEEGGQVRGSELIGQPFADPRYFAGRPSAAGPQGYDASASSASNLGPSAPALQQALAGRATALRDPDARGAIARAAAAPRLSLPADLITASGSGLDPHLSPAAALYQVPRVARLRGLSVERVRALVLQHVEGRTFGVLGEPRVNVLRLNRALDALPRG